ncbi:primosomal protein [bacterium]|nr:primosomal protein [bacterium]
MNKYAGLTPLVENYFLGASLNEEEQDNGEKHYYLEGIYCQANLENKNHRVYPIDVLRDAVNDYVEEWVKTNRALGELMHPEGLEVDLDRVCLRIIDLHQDSQNPANFIGKSRILDGTPKGDLVIGLLKGGTQLGVSTRGAGAIDENSTVNKLLLVAIDAVLNPSAPDAFMKALKEEQEFTNRFQTSAKTKFLKNYQSLVEETLALRKQNNANAKMKLLEDFIKAC